MHAVSEPTGLVVERAPTKRVTTSSDNDASEEIRLLARTGKGDRAAFRTLYERYSTPLFSLAVRLVGNEGDAEEVLQDAFVKIWRHAHTYDSRKSRPFTWAVTILRRTCIDHLRKTSRAPASVPLPEDGEAVAEIFTRDNIRHTAEIREAAGMVRNALDNISQPQRSALELALFSTLTHTEIAERLLQPVGTIKTWIRRGLLDLRATLKESAP